ncbi:hypothetical protein NW768_001112 [Fusarium equiseti]|uniref:Nucleoside phosphorylase domain-containing protein n=1 Tax=Fusarium equiseti TaxID=61235 RepID=A0ABQ8RPA6_FUSEQ|nr:hypothetical protein NW768_001112 [Fusarium equiseti]
MSIPANTQLCDFHIGWVCIMDIEYLAALDVLDERWSLDHNDSLRHGSNTPSGYELGKIGGHNVVINVPHKVKGGLPHAQEVTTQMEINFPYIKFVLLVGIGGAAPSTLKDIRLGDVVFGDSVIQYKKGRELDDRFEIEPQRLEPPLQLLTAVTQLKADLADGDPLVDILDEVANKSPRREERYRRPADDRLLKSDTPHQDGTCECLQPGSIASPRLVTRQTRTLTDYIKPHRGIIGSADQVLRNAQERDRLSREKNILCFEMEAAGVMSAARCITIRGIADYADGHKNDDWHSYAALAAAVCAKKLLIVLRPETVRGTQIDLSEEQFAVRFQGVTACINANLGSREKNAQDAFNNTQETIDLHEDQTKLFIDFTNAQKEKDQEMKIMLKSSQEVLEQQLKRLQAQIKRQRKENQSSEDVTPEDWKSLKGRVEERKRDVNQATQALGNVGDLLGIVGIHTRNRHLRFAEQYVNWTGRMIEWILLLKRNSGRAPSKAESDGISHSSRNPTPRPNLSESKANEGRSSGKWDVLKRFISGEGREKPDPEPLGTPPNTSSSEVTEDRTPRQSNPETDRSSSNIPTDQRSLSTTQDEEDGMTPGPPPRSPSDRSDKFKPPPSHSPPPIPPNRQRPPVRPKPTHLQTPPRSSTSRSPSRRPYAQSPSIGGSSSSNPRTESPKEPQVSRGTSEGQVDPSRFSFDERRKKFQCDSS